MGINKKTIFCFVISIQPVIILPVITGGNSQTESYLQALAPTRAQAYEKIKKVLSAPDPQNYSQFITIDPQVFEPLINEVIEFEKQNPDYYYLYHSSQKEGILLTLLRTYLIQEEEGWSRDDFFILRRPEFFYKKQASTAADYIKQNMAIITHQYLPGVSVYNPASNCINWQRDRCLQFDLATPYREHLISTSPAFIAGVDDTDNDQRRMSELDYTAWESSFYYFATNLSWSNVRRLYLFLVADLKKYYPDLFKNSPINIAVRKYIAIKFNNVVNLLFPHARQKLEPAQQIYAKAGMMFQFMIPKNVIDNVAYLAWANGIVWQRTINGVKTGWDDTIGTYTKLSSILDLLEIEPQKLGRSINFLQARIILKDKSYFYDSSSPIKIRLIHSLSPSLFRPIQDSLKSIARVVVENSKTQKKRTQQRWFEQANIDYEVKRYDKEIQQLLASNQLEQQLEGMNILYYFVHVGVDLPLAVREAMKYVKSNNKHLKAISNEIIVSASGLVRATK